MQLLRTWSAYPEACRRLASASIVWVPPSCQFRPSVALISALIPCSLASAALACALQSASSREIVRSSAPALTQSIVVGVCPAQTVSSRQPRAATGAASQRRLSRIVIEKSPVAPGASTLAPFAGHARRVAEFTRDQTGLEPGHKGVDAEYRQAQALRQGTGVGHHVGAFQEHRSDAIMACNELVAGGEDVPLRRGDVEPLLVVDHDAAELAAVIGADERRRWIGTGSVQMLRDEVRGAYSQHADPLAGRQHAFDERDLHQARGRDRHTDTGGDFTLIERQEPAGRRDAIGAQRNEFLGGGEESIEQTLGLLANDAARRRAGHHLVEDRKRPGLGIPHIPGNAREPRLQHQDADPCAVERLAAPGDPRSLNHAHWSHTGAPASA